MNQKIRIAIDGPSGSGKSTLAKKIAHELGLVYVDTGALYRAVGLYVKRAGADPAVGSQIATLLPQIQLALRYTEEGQRVILNGEDVSGLIRTSEVTVYATAVSAIPSVRKFLLEMQKRMAGEDSVVMDGRDIGTVIMPDADVKLFLEASPAKRAHRRFLELQAKGESVTEEEVLAAVMQRDKADSSRDVAPAIPAEDAIFIDNSQLDEAQTLSKALEIIREKLRRLR
ncbi:MAG: (d)CMP kinase [Clostridiales bacterium]|nr:(d)CMP kinase [Clostridiales bacterium]